MIVRDAMSRHAETVGPEFTLQEAALKMRSLNVGALPVLDGERLMGMDDACRIFGVSREEVAGMKGKELVRMYRRKAKELHPDRGGDNESFIRMGEAFACLMEKSGG